MKVLIVASYNKSRFAPFIEEQVEALRNRGVVCDYFGVEGKGVCGYLRNMSALRRKIAEFRPDVVHAHYGLSGLLANLQRTVPVVTTYHGSDINDPKVRPLSKISIRLSKCNIFVSQATMSLIRPSRRFALIPCGVDLTNLQLTEKADARRKMGLQTDKKYVLFAGAFDNPVKNASLAKETVALLPDVILLELKGYSREEVTLLMCAADAFLLTSHTEGSPQVIKEAMACGCPIVAVGVGDVEDRLQELDGCYVAKTREPSELAGLLRKAIDCHRRTKGRERIIESGLTNDLVAKELMDIYFQVANGRK